MRRSSKMVSPCADGQRPSSPIGPAPRRNVRYARQRPLTARARELSISAAMCAAVCQGAEHALLSGCTRLIPHSQRRASAVTSGRCARGSIVWSPRWGGQAAGSYALPGTRAWWPRVRRAGDDRPRYRPAAPARDALAHRRAARDRRGRTPNPGTGAVRSRGRCSRLLSWSGRWTSSARRGVYGTGCGKVSRDPWSSRFPRLPVRGAGPLTARDRPGPPQGGRERAGERGIPDGRGGGSAR